MIESLRLKIKNKRRKELATGKMRRRDPFAPSHTPLPKRLENLPSSPSLEAKMLEVIRDKTFNVPRYFTDRDCLNMDLEKAKRYVVEKWPIREAMGVLQDLKWAEIIPFQSYKARFDNSIDSFKVSGLKILTEVAPSGTGMTNIFFDRPLNEAQVKQLPRDEEIRQRYYQLGDGIADSPSLRKVYIKETERLLKSKNFIYDRHTLDDHANKLIIIQLPKEGKALVLTSIREWAYRNSSKFSTLIFDFSSNKNSQKFVDFLQKHNVEGLNAFYSLLLSEQLTPNISKNDRYQTFFVNENLKKSILSVNASLKEYPIEEGLIVKRLRPIET